MTEHEARVRLSMRLGMGLSNEARMGLSLRLGWD